MIIEAKRPFTPITLHFQVENLEHTKQTAADIEIKVTEAKKTSFEIDKAREFYRPAAARASVLYFILNDLHKINPIYQVKIVQGGPKVTPHLIYRC